MGTRTAIVLFNLGGPDSPEAVRPFLRNLFNDPAILRVPNFVRRPLSWFIAARRAPVAREIYSEIGGRSPILPQTEKQARALDDALAERGLDAKSFIAMRYWHPFADETVAAVKAYNPDRVILLPLYPQYSTTTTQSSFDDWDRAAQDAGLTAPSIKIESYPTEPGWVDAVSALLADKITMMGDRPYRVLFSAHGLPKNIVDAGDPYCDQVNETVKAVVNALNQQGTPPKDYQVCYQSRVGPLEWVGPNTEDEIARAGAEKLGLMVVPIAFVSEHSETLVELDIEYGELAENEGVKPYLRVPTVQDHPSFIAGLADLVEGAVQS